MGDKTSIEWTARVNPETGEITPGASWNPIVAYNIETGKRGWFCVHASEGCRNCYAEQLNVFRGNGLAYTAQNLNKIRFELAPKFAAPMHWHRPRTIFIDSMFDLFLEAVPKHFIDAVFAVMAQCPQHLFLLLTKNPKRMREYISSPFAYDAVDDFALAQGWMMSKTPEEWPLPNVWLGVSAERQKEADERIPELLDSPAAKRFISYEPALGPLNITAYLLLLDWVISGGESGLRARPPHPDWFRDVRDQCALFRKPFHFKQWGAWQNGSNYSGGQDFIVLNDGRFARCTDEFDQETQNRWPDFRSTMMAKVGKHASGALLDGREWRQFPK